MSMNCVITPNSDALPLSSYPIGTAMEGGYFYGVVVVDNVRWGLIMSPAANAVTSGKLKTNNDPDGTLADSTIDGWANTNNLNDALHPIYQNVRSMVINGYNDWYVPAVHELEPFYRNLKPYANANVFTNSNPVNGQPATYNPWSEPVGQEYTGAVPAQTSVVIFRNGQAQHRAAVIVSSTTLQSDASANYAQRHDTNSYGIISRCTKNYAFSTAVIVRPIRKFRMP